MTPPKARRCFPVADWPEIDRHLWEAGQSSRYVTEQRPASIAMIAGGYGRWISFLASRGQLDDRTPPVDRVTPESARHYVEHLRAVGNKSLTIETRLFTLAAALRILAPGRSFTWLHPCHQLRSHDRRRRSGETDADPTWNWPDIDRRLWVAGLRGGDILTGPREASRRRPATIQGIARTYGQWLRFLAGEGRLDPLIAPMTRVTRENVTAYLHALRERMRNSSIIHMVKTLRSAMRIMHPEADFQWLTSPGGQSLISLLPVTKKPISVIHCKVLYEWGLGLMRDALLMGSPDRRRLEYRNGLLIALFAARAPRVRSMASLRLGGTVIRKGETYRLVFEPDDVKTGRSIEYDAPASLSGAMDHYIAVERAELLAGKSHDWFWVDQYGEPLTVEYITQMVFAKSARAFGRPFGPHFFRHAIGTTAPMTDPTHPGVAAAILGISAHTVEEHYNRARQADVAREFHASFREDRAAMQSIAWREFLKRG